MSKAEAERISRLSALEQLRDQAREANRAAMLSNIEKLMESELRALHRLRGERPTATDDPGD